MPSTRTTTRAIRRAVPRFVRGTAAAGDATDQANHEPFKKTVEFVDVASRVSASLDVTFVCIGATARCDYVRDLQRTIEDRSMQDRVVLTGRIDDMPAVLSGLDLLVTLSGGSVMFEAQACGVAVLSARGDGRHSRHTRHGETGWCVSSDQSQAIAAAIELLLRDDDLRGRLARAGRDHVVSELSPARMAERTMAAYDVAFARCAAS
jgi:L-malate glycosyltransferase